MSQELNSGSYAWQLTNGHGFASLQAVTNHACSHMTNWNNDATRYWYLGIFCAGETVQEAYEPQSLQQAVCVVTLKSCRNRSLATKYIHLHIGMVVLMTTAETCSGHQSVIEIHAGSVLTLIACSSRGLVASCTIRMLSESCSLTMTSIICSNLVLCVCSCYRDKGY